MASVRIHFISQVEKLFSTRNVGHSDRCSQYRSPVLWIWILLGISTVMLLRPLAAEAREAPQCSGTVSTPHHLTIECRPGYATDFDRVIIYTPYELDSAKDWSKQLDYSSATWIFDAGADNRANLIIIFSRQGNEAIAQVYDDVNGDGMVSYRVDGVHVLVDEGSPTVIVRAKNDWLLPNGSVNFNFDMSIDGPVAAMIDAGIYLDQLKTDGVIDTVIHVRDTDTDGHPDYEWRQAFPPLPESSGFYRSSVMVNNADDEPPLSGSLWWPLLGSGAANFIKEDYASTSKPPINIDWRRSKINYIVESVASRNRPHNFFVYSVRRIEEGKINNVNFESPFAFYQFSPYQSNFPDVALRVAYWPKGDVASQFTVQQVDFSWRQSERNSGTLPDWDYRLGLLGHNEYQQLIVLPDFSLRMTPYNLLPAWVADNSWDYVSFVARERGDYLSSEGIYEWATLEGVIVDVRNQSKYENTLLDSRQAQEGYAKGLVDETPAGYYSQIREGLRGEFRDSVGKPRLYLSSVDRKLHLYGASHGIWQISKQVTLKYADLNRDSYFDQWLYTEAVPSSTAEPITRELDIAAQHVLYSDGAELDIRQARIKPSSFETPPPSNSEEWKTLGARIAAAGSSFDPGDLKALMNQVSGTETRITGAQMQEYRQVGQNGFRFRMTLRPGFQVLNEDLLAIRGYTPGEYVVTYDGRFDVAPLTPPMLDVEIGHTSLTMLEIGQVPIVLRNTGLQDVPSATLELWASTPAGQPTLVMTQTVALLGQASIAPALHWTPPTQGPWKLDLQIYSPGGNLLQAASAEAIVQPRADVHFQDIVPNSISPQFVPFAAFALVTFATIAGIVFWCGSPDGRKAKR